MSIAQLAVSDHLNNHELQKLYEKMVEYLKLSAVQSVNSQMNKNVYQFAPGTITVGKKKAVTYSSVAKVVADRFNNLDPAVKEAIRLDLGNNTAITESIRSHGFDMRSVNPIVKQIDVGSQFGFINSNTFSNSNMETMVKNFGAMLSPETPVTVKEALKNDLTLLESRYENLLPANWANTVLSGRKPVVPGNQQVVINKGLHFRVHQVKCIDETNPEWLGHDEIAWGGVGVDDANVTTKIPEFYVGGGFDDGDSKGYNPPKVIWSANINDLTYPKTFLVTLGLAEKDSNGLSEFINKLYEAIKAEVQLIFEALGAAAGAAVGTAIGGSVGTAIAGPLGTIIGIVAGAIIGALIGWLVGLLKDDIFPPMASSVTFNTTDDTFAGGSTVSPLLYFNYYGFGGHYRVSYTWQIIR